jgi:hypothetical protein
MTATIHRLAPVDRNPEGEKPQALSAQHECAVRKAGALTLRGYTPSYRISESNRCPGCTQSQWIVGRFSVECACCGTAVPIAGGA